jgi:VanZ family protein
VDWDWLSLAIKATLAAIPPMVAFAWILRRVPVVSHGLSTPRLWLLALVWAALILALSGSYFSYANTLRVVEDVLHYFAPSASEQTDLMVHLILRKGTHPLEYGLLFIFLVAGPLRNRRGLALAVCAVIALSDEGLQYLHIDRTGSLADASLDIAGAFVAGAVDLAVSPLRLKPLARVDAS